MSDRLVLITSAAHAAQFVLNGMLSAFLPLYGREVLSLTGSELGWLFGVQTVATLMVRPGDRCPVGSRRAPGGDRDGVDDLQPCCLLALPGGEPDDGGRGDPDLCGGCRDHDRRDERVHHRHHASRPLRRGRTVCSAPFTTLVTHWARLRRAFSSRGSATRRCSR